MRIEKTDIEFVIFDARDVIATSPTGGGTIGFQGYYWISKNGVDAFNENDQGYILSVPGKVSGLKFTPYPYEYAKYTVGVPPVDEDGDMIWGWAGYSNFELDSIERQYLITDDEIANRFDDVISWLKNESVRN